MQVDNRTEGVHAAIPMRDAEGREQLVCILRVSFDVTPGGAVAIAKDGRPPLLVDEATGPDPATSSLRRASDLSVTKPGTDVVLLGHAHPPAGREVGSVDVRLRVGPIDKAVRVFGARVFHEASFGRIEPGPPAPLGAPVPLVWERAWGGTDASDRAAVLAHPGNPLGRGVARDPRSLVGREAPSIEAVSGPREAPAGFSPLHRHWQPRAAFAGTYDEAWQRTRMPIAPLDYDARFEVAVPHDQWSPRPLRGDEPVEILGATPEGAWRFALPRFAPGFTSQGDDGRRVSHATHLDTFVIDADARRCELVWRAAVPLPAKWQRLERVTIVAKRLVRAAAEARAPS